MMMVSTTQSKRESRVLHGAAGAEGHIRGRSPAPQGDGRAVQRHCLGRGCQRDPPLVDVDHFVHRLNEQAGQRHARVLFPSLPAIVKRASARTADAMAASISALS